MCVTGGSTRRVVQRQFTDCGLGSTARVTTISGGGAAPPSPRAEAQEKESVTADPNARQRNAECDD